MEPTAIKTPQHTLVPSYEIAWGDGKVPTKILADGVVIAIVAGDQARSDCGTFSDPKTHANAHLLVGRLSLMKALIETADQLEDMIEAFEGLEGLDSFHRDTLANSRVVLGKVARAAIAKGTGQQDLAGPANTTPLPEAKSDKPHIKA